MGDLVGLITYEGAPPALPLLVRKGDESVKDAAVCAGHDVLDESLIVNTASGNGLQNVFVYLPRAPRGVDVPSPSGAATFDQKNCTYLPHCLTVRVGQTIRVLSGDGVQHNVHTFPLRNTPFNQSIQPNDREGLQLVYQQPEARPVEVKCDIHPWMRAYHLPLDHSYAAITDENGRFQIPDLPAGRHQFRIWHERADLLEREYEVEIKPDETTEVTLSFGAEKFAARDLPQLKTVVLSSSTK